MTGTPIAPPRWATKHGACGCHREPDTGAFIPCPRHDDDEARYREPDYRSEWPCGNCRAVVPSATLSRDLFGGVLCADCAAAEPNGGDDE